MSYAAEHFQETTVEQSSEDKNNAKSDYRDAMLLRLFVLLIRLLLQHKFLIVVNKYSSQSVGVDE